MNAGCRRTDSGLALVACMVIIMGALLLVLAAQQIVRESSAAAFNSLDHAIAMQAAEAALMDAEIVIAQAASTDTLDTLMLDQWLAYGAETSNIYLYGGKLQSMQRPTVKIAQHALVLTVESVAPARRFYRITAVGTGMHVSTQVVLQSDFLPSVCSTQAGATCVDLPHGRIAWRELPAYVMHSSAANSSALPDAEN